MKISKKQKAILKSYARGVLVSFLTFLASNELGLDPALSVVIAALAGWLWRWRYGRAIRRSNRITFLS
jgi:hypothetical protein